jgi:hypothetical protein
MKSPLRALLLFVLVLSPLQGWALDSAKSKVFKVHVNIQGEQEIGVNLAKHLQDEFRALTDVELVKEKPDWKVDMITAAMRNDKKETLTYVVSVLTTQQFPAEYWNGVYETVAESVLRRQHEQKDKGGKVLLPDKKSLETLRPAWTATPSRTVLDLATDDLMRQHGYYLKGEKDLRVLAKDIVATFDKTHLEPQRKKQGT